MARRPHLAIVWQASERRLLTPPRNGQGLFGDSQSLLRLNLSDKCIWRRDVKMSHFRCYLLNTADKIVSVDSLEAESDGAAMEMAGQLILSKHSAFAAIEIWDCARCVGKITSPTDRPNLDSILKIS